MKKVFTTLVLLMITIVAIAQVAVTQPTQRGNFVIGTRIGFATSKSSVEVETASGILKGDGGTSAQFNLAPNLGYFLANNFVMGISFDWLRTGSSSGIDLNGGTTTTQKASNNVVLFGPFARYFIPVSDDKAFFIGSNLGFGNSKNQFTANNLTQSIQTSLLNWGVGPGFTIFARNGLALETLVKYNFAKSKSDIDVQGIKRTSTTWTNAVDFSVGLQYYFRGFRSYN
jgi:hypothetical protein